MTVNTFDERIKAIRKTKLEFNDIKISRLGSYNFDDHGWIPFEKPIEFEIVKEAQSGLTTGMEAVSKTFANYLDAHPVYMHPESAFAGAWAGNVPGIGDPWRIEHRLEEHEPLFKKYNITSRGLYAMNHSAPDINIGLKLGFRGILDKIRFYRDFNRPADTSFYDGEERLVEALIRFIGRHAKHAGELAISQENEYIRKNLLELACINEKLMTSPPDTLREAMQLICWFQVIDRMYFNGGAGQQLDELLRPYYEADIKAGRITDDEEVIWYVASLLFNDTHYYQIGGQSSTDGHDLTSKLSFLILEGMHRLNIPSNIALRVHSGMDDELLDKAVKYLFEDGTGVCYSCSKGLDEGFMKNGFPAALARLRAKVGCNWTALPGIEYALQDVTRVCLAQPMLLALDEMIESDEENSMSNLLKRYEIHLSKAVSLIKDGVDWHVKYKHLNKPEMVLNLFSHGAIERGVDVSCGGVDIYNFACDGTALATVADSLGAIEKYVVCEKSISWEMLRQILKQNWEDFEDIRLMFKDTERYGSGNSKADYYAKLIADMFTAIMSYTPTKGGYRVLPGIFSHGDVYKHGENLQATPNGRFKGDPISHSADPDPGFLPGGGTAPTAKANAVARVQSGYGNSTPLQVDMDSLLVKDIGGREIVKAYIRAHNEMGGTLININVVSRDKLLEAHENPDKYPDLVVRVTGYSAFFKSLSKEYRQQVVDRWLTAK